MFTDSLMNSLDLYALARKFALAWALFFVVGVGLVASWHFGSALIRRLAGVFAPRG